MAFSTIDAEQYSARLRALPEGLRTLIQAMHMPDPMAASAIALSEGSATTAPPEGHRYVVVEGDLTVFGRLNMLRQTTEEEDGDTVLIVTGDLRCTDLIQHYGGVILVGGDLIVSHHFEASFMDSMAAVLGSVRVKYYHGLDIWIEFGGRCEIDTGWGYGLPIGYTNAAAQAVYPTHQGEAIYDALGIPKGEREARTLALMEQVLSYS